MATPQTIRFSQFNASLNRNTDGQLTSDLSNPNNAQAQAVAETIQRVNPDVLLINEFDYEASAPLMPVQLLQKNYLGISQNGADPVEYPYVYLAPSNTGIASGLDLDNNGEVVTTVGAAGYGNDAFGFGNFPGQFGMLLLSKYPIDVANVRTFQNFLWKDMPGNLLTNDPTIDNPNTPVNENLNGYYAPEEIAQLRLSSKSHWDVPILVNGSVIHVLVSHPTPPVFDGTEDRNGKRNSDEIRFWSDYITPDRGGYIYDDKGGKGGLKANVSFVIMGDQNADPVDGDSYNNAILQLLNNSKINPDFTPSSPGGVEQSSLDGGVNLTQRGNPAFDTADFGDTSSGNLRADYILPSNNLDITDGAVFWPLTTDPLYRLVGDRQTPATTPASDHSLIWADIPVSPPATITSYDWQNLPKLGTSLTGQDILLGGFSGLAFQGLANNGNLKFTTVTDRGPNGEANGSKRPFALPDFQPEIIQFELNRTTKEITITDRIQLTAPDGKTPITGLPNLQAGQNGLAYTDEVPVDLNGKTLANDPLGADTEGIVVAPNGDYWLVDEYRPAIYQFDSTGKLLNRYIPQGTAAAVGQPIGTFGTEVLPSVYAQRRANRGFEAIALEGTKLYAFIQSALDNPDSTGDTTSRASRNLRILEFDVVSQLVTGEYIYLLDSITGSGNARTDKIGDAVTLGNGKFLVVERDDRDTAESNKLIYQIDLKNATNINAIQTSKTIEQLTPAELTADGIQPVDKRLLLNAAEIGYTGVGKLEGLTIVDADTIALLNDNDFGITGTQFNNDGSVALTFSDVPVKLGLIDLPKDLPIAQPTFPNGIASGDTIPSTTTWEIDGYTEDELLSHCKAILERQPTIVSQFEVEAKLSGTGTVASNRLGTMGQTEPIVGVQPGSVLM
jgi:hypothetical protein